MGSSSLKIVVMADKLMILLAALPQLLYTYVHSHIEAYNSTTVLRVLVLEIAIRTVTSLSVSAFSVTDGYAVPNATSQSFIIQGSRWKGIKAMQGYTSGSIPSQGSKELRRSTGQQMPEASMPSWRAERRCGQSPT